jgi:hypothetical protein
MKHHPHEKLPLNYGYAIVDWILVIMVYERSGFIEGEGGILTRLATGRLFTRNEFIFQGTVHQYKKYTLIFIVLINRGNKYW